MSSVTKAEPPPPAVELGPLDDWQLARLDDSCLFTREFGTPDEPVTMKLDNIDPWDGGFRVILSGGGIDWTGQEFRAGWVPDGKFVAVENPTVVTVDSGKEGVLFHHALWDEKSFDLSSKEWDAYFANEGPRNFKEAVKGFSLVASNGGIIALHTGPMQDLIERRDDCIDEMLAAKGVDPRDEDRSDHRVEAVNATELALGVVAWLPPSMNLKERSLIDFLMYVDADGKPTSCRQLVLPLDADYERKVCNFLMESAQFRFKKGEAAQPTFWKLSVRYSPS